MATKALVKHQEYVPATATNPSGETTDDTGDQRSGNKKSK